MVIRPITGESVRPDLLCFKKKVYASPRESNHFRLQLWVAMAIREATVAAERSIMNVGNFCRLPKALFPRIVKGGEEQPEKRRFAGQLCANEVAGARKGETATIEEDRLENLERQTLNEGAGTDHLAVGEGIIQRAFSPLTERARIMIFMTTMLVC
jgi:hypothetical protein